MMHRVGRPCLPSLCCKWCFASAQVASLGKSGVSVGYYDTEEAAARAYDRAAIGLLGRDSAGISTNFAMAEYDAEAVPHLIGKTREEVKAMLKSERAKVLYFGGRCRMVDYKMRLADCGLGLWV